MLCVNPLLHQSSTLSTHHLLASVISPHCPACLPYKFVSELFMTNMSTLSGCGQSEHSKLESLNHTAASLSIGIAYNPFFEINIMYLHIVYLNIYLLFRWIGHSWSSEVHCHCSNIHSFHTTGLVQSFSILVTTSSFTLQWSFVSLDNKNVF